MPKGNPCTEEGGAPFRALDRSLDLDRWEVWCLNVEFDVLEVFGVVFHVENEAASTSAGGKERV